jgi:hypothetical protein
MCGGEAFTWIGMQDTGCWNPMIEDRSYPIPDHAAALTLFEKDG